MTRSAIKVIAGFAIFTALRVATIFGSHAYDAATATPVQTETRGSKIERLEQDIEVSKEIIKDEFALAVVAYNGGNVNSFKEQRDSVRHMNHILREQQKDLQSLITDADFARPSGRCYKAYVAKRKSSLLNACFRYQETNANRFINGGVE